jgi:hypothetical protein
MDVFVCQIQIHLKKQLSSGILTIAHPQTASFGPERRFRSFEILNIVLLCLRFQSRSCLAPNHNPPFVDGHELISFQKFAHLFC